MKHIEHFMKKLVSSKARELDKFLLDFHNITKNDNMKDLDDKLTELSRDNTLSSYKPKYSDNEYLLVILMTGI